MMTADAAYESTNSQLSTNGGFWREREDRMGLTEREIVKASRDNLPTSVFSDSPINLGLYQIRARLRELLALRKGWDGHEGKPIDSDVANFAYSWISTTLGMNCPTPQVVPLSYGGVQFEWHERNIDLEIEFEAPNEVSVFFEDHLTAEEVEGKFSTDYGRVAALLKLLSDREP